MRAKRTAMAAVTVCAGLLWTASGTAQAINAPAGARLQVTEAALDFSKPAAVQVHMQVVNGSTQALRVLSEAGTLVAVERGGGESRCVGIPNSSARPDALPRALRPGESLAETLTLNADVCNGLRGAQAVRVERNVLTANNEPVTLLSQPVPVHNGNVPADAASEAIRAMLAKQAEDWNRGDLDAFASGYKNSPDILFIGKSMSRGYEGMLAAYKHNYPTREAMGSLGFTELEVQPLDAKFATVTGHFHLLRTSAGGGDADGFFLLVVENTASGWKIVRDDTTASPRTASH